MHPSQTGDPAEAFNERSYDDAPAMGSYEDLLAYLRRGEGPLIAPPGEVVSYSNDAYGLLGAVVEAATGVPFGEAVRERVFAPLGMDGATFDTADARASGELTQLYTPSRAAGPSFRPAGRRRRRTWRPAS
ncbi:MAG: serine hydrolase domain-containing protein [Trueperaceae bacterium]|nr:serine hydrolase domain-containing protein [Trueperaceae bacterium]